MLLQTTGAQLGYLYGLRERGLVLLAPAQTPAPPGLEPWLHTREYAPLLLCGKHAGKVAAGGMLVLHFASGRRAPTPRATVEAVTELLMADGIMEPVAM